MSAYGVLATGFSWRLYLDDHLRLDRRPPTVPIKIPERTEVIYLTNEYQVVAQRDVQADVWIREYTKHDIIISSDLCCFTTSDIAVLIVPHEWQAALYLGQRITFIVCNKMNFKTVDGKPLAFNFNL